MAEEVQRVVSVISYISALLYSHKSLLDLIQCKNGVAWHLRELQPV